LGNGKSSIALKLSFLVALTGDQPDDGVHFPFFHLAWLFIWHGSAFRGAHEKAAGGIHRRLGQYSEWVALI
jgi:hypothetical protein